MTKIVIVEDDESIAQMYSFKLEAEGFQVTVAENGQIGLDVIKSVQPEIILLDLMIPVLSGDKMLENMRAQEWGTAIKVIVLTNISRNDAPPSLNQLNVDRYVVKAQVTPSQLVTLVKEVLASNTHPQ
jgi:DNA-binding response OmpR family regulator